MHGRFKLLPYALAVAAVIGGFVVALTLFFPEPSQSAPTAETSRSASPRIAAWQERIAEEKLYAEKEARRVEAEKAADLAARQQSRERAMARAQPAQTPKIFAQDTRGEDLRAKELAREREQARQKARQMAARQQQFGGEVALGYAPEPSRARFNNIYSAMRETRGGN